MILQKNVWKKVNSLTFESIPLHLSLTKVQHLTSPNVNALMTVLLSTA